MTGFNDLGTRALGGLLVQVLDDGASLLMAKAAGLDFLLLDGEHGDLDHGSLGELLLLADACGLPTVVRVPELTRAWVSHTLDLGATGVMVPMVETATQARRLVEWAKYPPLGRRSYSGGGHTGYGPSGNHGPTMAAADAGTLAVVQIETVAGVDAVDEILSVPGVGAAVVGPCDLAISLGRPDDVGCDEELALIDRVRDACRGHGTAFGIIGSDALLGRYAGDLDLMVSAIDTHLLRDAFARARASYDALVERGAR